MTHTLTVDNNYSLPRHLNVHQRRHNSRVFSVHIVSRSPSDFLSRHLYCLRRDPDHHAIIRRRGIGLYATSLPSLTTSAQANVNVFENLNFELRTKTTAKQNKTLF